MIEVGNIVTLENGQEYLLLEELDYEGKNYLYAVRTLDDETPTDEYLIFESMKENDEEFLKVVSDKELYDALIEEFRIAIAEKILEDDSFNTEEETN